MSDINIHDEEALGIIRTIVNDWSETVDPEYASDLLNIIPWGAWVNDALELLELRLKGCE